MTVDVEVCPFRNRVLAALPAAEMQHVKPHLLLESFAAGQILHRVGERIEHLHFIEHGLASATVPLERLPQGEVPAHIGLIGKECVTGVIAALNPHAVAFCEISVNVPGAGYRMSVSALHDCLPRAPVFNRMLAQNVGILMAQTAQTSACSSLHNTRQRLARWLLMIRDRASRDELNLPHDLLADMLSVTRSSLMVAMQLLQHDGILLHTRLKTTILDRAGLEHAACECYGKLRAFTKMTVGSR